MSVSVPSKIMTTHSLKDRHDLHLARKIWHFTGVVLIAVIYHNVSRPFALQLITLVGSLVIFLDVFRQYSSTMNQILIRIFGPLLRKNEADGLTGSSYLVLGVFIIIALFPKDVVKLSLFFLATADPLASYVGIRFGKDRLWGRKSLQGSLAAFVICTLIAFFYYLSRGIMVEKLLIVSVLSGLIGAFSELVPIAKLDDNLVIPVLSASLLYGIFLLFGGF